MAEAAESEVLMPQWVCRRCGVANARESLNCQNCGKERGKLMKPATLMTLCLVARDLAAVENNRCTGCGEYLADPHEGNERHKTSHTAAELEAVRPGLLSKMIPLDPARTRMEVRRVLFSNLEGREDALYDLIERFEARPYRTAPTDAEFSFMGRGMDDFLAELRAAGFEFEILPDAHSDAGRDGGEKLPASGGTSAVTPEERAASIIDRIGATTGTEELARMIAEEIRAAVVARDENSGPQMTVAMEPPRRVGVAVLGRPEGVRPGWRVVRHPVFDRYGGDSPFGSGLSLRCRICAADEPEPGKTVLYLTSDGYHCEACAYDEYINLRTHSLSLFPVQFHTRGEVEDGLREELYEDDDAQPDDELIERLTREISEDIKSSEFLKPLPDLVSMLMRGVYYRVLRRHKRELPAGYKLPDADFAP